MRLPAVTIIGTLLLSGCGACGASHEKRVNGPDGKLQAVIFNYDCGATTGFSTQISILPLNEKVTKPGNIFIADNLKDLKLTWSSPNTLVIKGTSDLKIYKQESTWKDVAIQYP